MVKLDLNLSSKYLSRFEKLAANQLATLTGSRILIEPIELGEIKTESGLFLASPENQARSSFNAHKAHVGRILMTGQDNKVPDTEFVLKPGHIVLLSEYGVKPYSAFLPGMSYADGDLQLSHTSEVHLVFETDEAFQKAIGILNS
jgi:hypothetical protein